MAYSVIGKPYVGPDVPPKSSGQAKFIDDLALPGMLFGRLLRCPYPNARIVSIDVSEAIKHPGVRAVITGAEFGSRKYGLAPNVTADREPLVREWARYAGEEVAAVAAVDEDTAEEALRLIHVVYEELPGTLPIEAITWRLRASGPAPSVAASLGVPQPGRRGCTSRPAWFPELRKFVDTPVYDRYALKPADSMVGPAIVEERESTAVIGPRARATVDRDLNLVIDVAEDVPR